MTDISKIDYSALDRPEVTMFLFHPRAGLRMSEWDVFIPTEGNVIVGGRFHIAEKTAPNILFFHGNGEIVGDYDDVAQLYNEKAINFLPVDYRGYGRSTGRPTVTAMMRDCHVIFDFTKKWLKENGCSGPLIIMGRSLGSASALEIAAHYKDQIAGLIIESGFAYARPLLQLLGINVQALGLKDEEGFRNADKIRDVEKPVLVIHAEHDHIIPFSDGQSLYDSCQSDDKTLLKIPGANHNDILLHGLSEYMAAIKTLADKTGFLNSQNFGDDISV
ncbi:alpha/beta fold hydrolase [Desulfococcaceae bacterium HSG8]|nr:alpha/beta fold hydrolase [Desulfococcaceae bacterium HSG8]